MTNVNGGKWIRPEKRLAIYLRDGFQCLYCNCDLRDSPAAYLTLDHLVARTNGGSNEADNLVTACLPCNASRRHKEVLDFASNAAIHRIAIQHGKPLNLELAKAILSDEQADVISILEDVR